MDPKVKATGLKNRVGDKTSICLSIISKGSKEIGLLCQGVIILKSGKCSVSWMKFERSQFFKIVMEEGDLSGISFGFDFRRI